jgi:hypothetical protein
VALSMFYRGILNLVDVTDISQSTTFREKRQDRVYEPAH